MIKKVLKKLLFLIVITFFNISFVSAAQKCNISSDYSKPFGYGAFMFKEDKSVQSSSNVNVYKYVNGQIRYDLFFPGYNNWSEKERELVVEFTANKNGHKLNEGYFKLFNNLESKTPVCELNFDIKGKEVAAIYVRINKGLVSHIVAGGSYVNEKGEVKKFDDARFVVKKAKPEGESTFNTTVDSVEDKPIESSGVVGSAHGENAVINGEKPYTTTTVKNNDVPLYTDEEKEYASEKIVCDEKMKVFIHTIWEYVVVLSPIGLIVLCTFDFLKATFKDDAEAVKKASSATVKRVLALILLLALPLILKTIFVFVGIDFCF